MSLGALPSGLAHHAPLRHDIAAGEVLRWDDVAMPADEAVGIRREMEARHASSQ